MKKAIVMLMFGGLLAQAGVVKVALFPVVHSKKTAHGLKKAVKSTVKGVAKAAYNL